LSDNGEGNPETVEFEELDLEEPTATKEEQIAAFLKEKLSEEDFGQAAKILGIEGDDLSNAELLERLTVLLKGKKEDEEEEDEDEDKKLEGDHKAFMKECMAEGKTLTECAEEWKKKYPEPKEKEEEAALAKKKGEEEEEDKMAGLEARIQELEGKLHLEKVTNEVNGLVSDKHLSPRQKAPIIKLSARMDDDMRAEFLEVFKTQKFTVTEDKGIQTSRAPGTALEIDEETRKKIMESHGISSLIEDKGVRNQ
jgi:hypothetical protein